MKERWKENKLAALILTLFPFLFFTMIILVLILVFK
jgi:hypothetical protein